MLKEAYISREDQLLLLELIAEPLCVTKKMLLGDKERGLMNHKCTSFIELKDYDISE